MNAFVEKYKSLKTATTMAFGSFVLILVLSQTLLCAAAPALPLPISAYHFHYDILPAKRSDKGLHPPAAAAEWKFNEGIQQVDVNVADLEELKEPTLHNLELDLKQIDEKWHEIGDNVKKSRPDDELVDELKHLEQRNNGSDSNVNRKGSSVSAAGAGQPEQDDRMNYYNETPQPEEVGQPTEQQIQRERQQIDDEIQGEINKDLMESIKTFSGAARIAQNGANTPAIQQKPPQTTKGTNGEPITPTRTNKMRIHSQPAAAVTASPVVSTGGQIEKSIVVPPPSGSHPYAAAATVDAPPVNQQEEQMELLKETPHQNEDVFNLFTNNGNRRSANNNQKHLPTLSVVVGGGEDKHKLEMNMGKLLKAKNGGYTPYDLAQYIFWTGDEAGVAQAIEDLIDEGLMSRENAIKFLRDIRTGMDYLQNAYGGAADDLTKATTAGEKEHSNQVMKPVTPVKLLKQIPGTTIKGQMNTTPASKNMAFNAWNISPLTKPSYDFQQPSSSLAASSSQQQQLLPPSILKAIERIPSLVKLNEMMTRNEDESTSSAASSSMDYDEMSGRLRLADFLYAEYSLEEVIYHLAKVMFSQALTQGSPSAQEALQKFIGFLEEEGNQGRISLALQKKVIDVLLAALSDTLVEHPELLNQARTYLGNSLNQLNN